MPSPVQTSGYRVFWDTPVLQAAERAMNHATARQRLLANNLANVNTPGYIRHDLPLPSESARNRAVELALRHGVPIPRVPDSPTATQARFLPVPTPTAMRTDGNTVDPEYELAALAENELRYAMLVRIASGQVRSLLNAITGGKTP
jgi:flagellar basal-body rod protein FlgB